MQLPIVGHGEEEKLPPRVHNFAKYRKIIEVPSWDTDTAHREIAAPLAPEDHNGTIQGHKLEESDKYHNDVDGRNT
jgi:ribosomal protein S30